MRKKEITIKAVAALKEMYPEAICSLCYTDAFQLLIATRLSAQCTDARVNMVTPALFEKYPTPQKMAKADIADIEKLIKSCGLYKTKAKDLKGIAERICNTFDGKVPDNIEDLTSLPGVGRKTANLIMGDVYKKSAVVCDTHFIRLCNRLHLVSTKDPLKVEKTMRELLPAEESSDFCHRTVLFGRDVCTARRTYCEKCKLNSFCPSAEK